MWSMLKFFFRKEAVVAELKGGALASGRVRDFLLFTLLFSTLLRMISSLGGVLGKMDLSALTGLLVAMCVVIGILVITYFLLRAMLLSLYEANGGDQGQHFLERLVVLGISAMVRVTPFSLAAGLLIGLLFVYFPAETWVAALMGFGLLALVIGIVIWVYYYIKDGFLKVRV